MATPLVKSSAGAGTRRPSLQTAVSKISLRSSSILFVDDDEAFSYAAAKELRAAGYGLCSHPSPRLPHTAPPPPLPPDHPERQAEARHGFCAAPGGAVAAPVDEYSPPPLPRPAERGSRGQNRSNPLVCPPLTT